MIPLQEQEALRRHFSEQMTGGVKIEHFTQRPLSIVVPGREECLFCAETRQLLEELRSLSPKISLRVHELSEAAQLAATLGVDRAPAIVLRGQLNRPQTFYGFPGGGLFPVLVDVILWASRGTTGLDARTKRRLERIRDDLPVRVFVSPTSPYSAPMTQASFQLGLENRRLKVAIFEVGQFPRLVESFQIRAVPFTVIGDRVRFTGVVSTDALLDQLIKAVEGRGLAAREGLLGSVVGPSTPLQAAAEPRTTRGGLILPGR